jgi:hypothetical protein
VDEFAPDVFKIETAATKQLGCHRLLLSFEVSEFSPTAYTFSKVRVAQHTAFVCAQRFELVELDRIDKRITSMSSEQR